MTQPNVLTPEELTVEQVKLLDDFIAAQPRRDRSALIPVLHRAQEIVGYLPPGVQAKVATALNLHASEVQGVVTFYHYFSTKPRGRHTVNVCLGTACYVRGAKKVLDGITDLLDIKMGETTEDRRFTLTAQRCFGACGLAPVVMIDNDVHGRMTAKKLSAILGKYS
jgi:NADH-quinone oxidoreductase E subunit